MIDVVRKEILKNLTHLIKILKQEGDQKPEKLRTLSDDSTEDIALHKDFDLISVVVLIHSLSKVFYNYTPEEINNFLKEAEYAKKYLEQNNLGRYNKAIKELFKSVTDNNARVKSHLDDIMHAARIKKSATLLQKGLSIGQAAGLMGLSNWDLQQYVGRTIYQEVKEEEIQQKKRLDLAFEIFDCKNIEGKEKIIFFDAGPIISLVMSRLSWILPKLKKSGNCKFYITPAVKKELVDRPLTTKRFELEAIQVLKMIRNGILEVYTEVPEEKVKHLINLANNSFKIKNKNIDIIQSGEVESIASASKLNADALIMDERTLRLFVEKSSEMEKLLEMRFKKDVIPNEEKIKLFSEELKNIKIIRSAEMVAIAYKRDLLNSHLPIELANPEDILLDSVLWAVKTNGCAITGEEIEAIKTEILSV